jgi:hypothetical protein
MYTGEKLGAALKEAIQLKAELHKKPVRQVDVGKAFGVKQSSVAEWIKYGRISKEHIPRLVEWFSDVVGPEHWGLPPSWGGESSGASGDGLLVEMSPTDWDMLTTFKALQPEDRRELFTLALQRATKYRDQLNQVIDRHTKAAEQSSAKPRK